MVALLLLFQLCKSGRHLTRPFCWLARRFHGVSLRAARFRFVNRRGPSQHRQDQRDPGRESSDTFARVGPIKVIAALSGLVTVRPWTCGLSRAILTIR